jgi:hypothetical protein
MGTLRRLFGSDKDEIWSQLAREIAADFTAGGFRRRSKVTARVHEWTVTLDTHVVSSGKSHVEYTRMRAPYVNGDGFRFTIYRRGLFSNLGKWLGGQDIEIFDPEFDEAFIIKGTDEDKVRGLLLNSRLRALISAQPKFHLEVCDDEGWFGASFPEGVDELRFQVIGVIKDVERLKALYELFAEVLQQLCRIGSAYEKDPQVNLK